MASHNHLDDDDDFGGDFSGNHNSKRPGGKRSFGDIEDDEDDIFGPKKMELEAAKSISLQWHSACENESFISAGSSAEPKLVINYLQMLSYSEESFKERSAVRDLKSQLKPASIQARRLLLDIAIHEEFTRLKNLVEGKDKKVKELQDNIATVNLTPQSKMGKMLMAKCRTFQEENEEIGNQAAEGKMHELVMKLALQKSQNAELRSQFEGLCKHLEGLTNDAEKSNEMVRILQDKLKEKEHETKRLKLELQQKSLVEESKTEPSPKKAISEEVV